MTRKEEIKQETEFMLMHGEVKETKDFIKGAPAQNMYDLIDNFKKTTEL